MADDADTPSDAPSLSDRHPLGSGDLHDRVIACEMAIKQMSAEIMAEIGKIKDFLSDQSASGTEVDSDPASD